MKPEDARVVTKDEYIAFFLVAYGVLMPDEDIEQSAKMLAIEVRCVCGMLLADLPALCLRKIRARCAPVVPVAISVSSRHVGRCWRYDGVAAAC